MTDEHVKRTSLKLAFELQVAFRDFEKVLDAPTHAVSIFRTISVASREKSVLRMASPIPALIPILYKDQLNG